MLNTEDRLVEKFVDGDPKALEAIYHKYHDQLFYFSYRLTGIQDVAADIVMETLTVLLRRHKDFVTSANIKAFLYISVRNKSLNFLQQAGRQKASFSELHYTQADKVENPILTEIIRAEFLKEVYHEIEQLPEKRREVLKLFFIEGRTTDEVAEIMNMLPETVRANKSKAVEQLRQNLARRNLLHLCMLFAPLLTMDSNTFHQV